MTNKFDIFISYRREGGFEVAKRLNDLLVHDGYTVCFDIETIREGDFNEALLKRIEHCVDFILVVDEHAFDRTLDPNFNPKKDWLRIELAYALKLNKNIIPLLLSGFEGFPDNLPKDIAGVVFKNGPLYSESHIDVFYLRLKKFLNSEPKKGRLEDKDYFAFISYKSEDVEWAIWLQHELEHYHLPASFNGRTDVRQNLRPVFRDIDELSAGNLPSQIEQALVNSQNLIVICSPQAAKSPWVNQEIKTFISLGRTDRIYPLIVEGNCPSEFFPPALLNLPKEEERLGGDITKTGRDVAFVKVVAGMLGLGFDSLWNRYEKEKAEDERKQREQRDSLLRVQSRFIAEKAKAITDKGDSYLAAKLLLEVFPEDLANPNRPYTSEAEDSLRYAISHSSAVLGGNMGIVNVVVYSPDGKTLISGSSDCIIYMWNVKSGKILRELRGHTAPVTSLSISSDGKYLASSAGFPKSKDDTIRIWDIQTGDLIRTIHNNSWSVYHVAFNHKTEQFVSATEGRLVCIWDTIHAMFPRALQAHTWPVYSAVFSPDGNIIVSAAADNTIRIWDSSTGEVLRTLLDHLGVVNSVAFCPDGKYFVSASDDKTVRIWNTLTGELLQTFEGHTDKVKSAIFSPDGRFVISVSADKTIRIWDTALGLCIKTLTGHKGTINSIDFSPIGNNFITSSEDGTIRIWDASEDGFHSIDLFSVKPQKVIRNPDYSRNVEATGSYVSIYSVGYEHLFYNFEAHKNDIRSISYSADAKRIVSASTDFTIRIWDAYNATLIQTIDIPVENVYNAFFSPDGRRVFVTTEDRSVFIIEVATGRIVYILEDVKATNNEKANSQLDDSNLDEIIPLQELIDQTRERFKDNPLTQEERLKYYLE